MAVEKLAPALERKLAALPDAPGVYLLLGSRGEVLYVGKAKSLRNRVRAYFQRNPADGRPLLPYLLARVADLDLIQVPTEKEALLLEDSLIKRHRPRYNVRLVDDKSFLSLRLDRRHPFPRFTTVRRPRPDGARYFGPYASAGAVRETLTTVYRAFGIRSCSDAVFANRSRPCLYYQIGQCLAPCVGRVGEAEYAMALSQAERLLEGRHQDLVRELEREMAEAAAAERFEAAARLRDRIRALRRTVEPQAVASSRGGDFDAIGHHRFAAGHVLVLLQFRSGRLTGSETLRAVDRSGLGLPSAFGTLLLGCYEARPVPPEVILAELPGDAPAVAELLAERAGHPVRLTAPSRGLRRRLLEMAEMNARHAATLEQRRGERNERLLESLREALALPRPPRRIECFDVSNLGGTLTVAAMSVAIDGQPARGEYRRYRVRTAARGDDLASLHEVLARRLRRGRDEGNLPDLLLVDGGRGQLAAARAAAAAAGVDGLPIAAIAKGPDRNAGREELYLDDHTAPLRLARDDDRLALLQRVRDEAHRWAIQYNRRLRRSRDRRSALEAIPGIGPRLSQALLRRFGSLEGVASAGLAELRTVPALGAAAARRLRAALARREGPGVTPPGR